MTPVRVLLVDDAAAVTELFASVMTDRFGWDVDVLSQAAAVTPELVAGGRYDLAVVDLSFPGEQRNGLDVLLTIHRASPDTRLVALTQGDDWVADLLQVAWEALPLASALSKTSMLDTQLDQLHAVVRDGTAPADPILRPWLPSQRSPWRTAEGYGRLVAHRGHAKLWRALMDAPEEPSYRALSASTGLKLNTLKNYRSQLLGELALHGLDEPSMREMHLFARRCRPLLEPFVDLRLGTDDGDRDAAGAGVAPLP